MDGEPGSLGHIHGQELYPAFHEIRDEGDGSSQPVELGDNEGCPLSAAELERLLKLRAIRPLSALHLNERSGEFAADPLDIAEDRLALGVQSQAGAALSVGRNAVVGDEKRNWMRIHGNL